MWNWVTAVTTKPNWEDILLHSSLTVNNLNYGLLLIV